MTVSSLPGLPAGRAVWQATWRRWLYGDTPADVETAYLRSLFGNYLSSSPACIFASIYLFLAAPVLPEGPGMALWVITHVVYHLIRTLVGLAYLSRSSFSAEELRRWGLVSWSLQLVGGLLMLILALGLYPQLEFMAQAILLLVVFIVVGASAFSLAGRWATIAVYATPTYLGFAWATWPLEHAYARPLALLSLLFFVLYLFQARTQERVNRQSFELARRNGELAQELKAKNAELEEVAGARSRLLATVSHDLRQPAHAIGLLCERAMIDQTPAHVQAILRDLNELSQSLSASLTTLMDLTRLDAGLVQAQPVSMPLGQVLLRLEAEFSASARNKGLRLVVPSSSAWVRSDPVLLHGVLANLVSNAIKYTRTGQVVVELRPQEDGMAIGVRDTGPGIPPDKLNLIFKEFVRLDASESGTEGLGLGLSIVRRYAALLGLELKVDSLPGRGSSFFIRLPAAAAPRCQAELSALASPLTRWDTRLSGVRVLVVDNVELLLTSMAKTLSAWGCEVHSAHNLAEAQAVASRHGLDLVISDFHLGDQESDGLAVITALRRLQPGGSGLLPAALMTGDVSSRLEADARRQGVRVLHKPVRPAVLQNCVLGLLPRARAV